MNCPLHEGTRGLVNADLLKHFKKVSGYFGVSISISTRANRELGSSTRPVALSATKMPLRLPSRVDIWEVTSISAFISQSSVWQPIGYSGDVWNVQPAPRDHVWRTMKNPLGAGNGMVPHYSGTTIDAQARYANGTKSILERYISGKAQEPQNVIVGLSKWSLVYHPVRQWLNCCDL